ncbi:MAG TPA: hypothetical protein PLN78_06000, partial [Pseudomonadales bacterium]|nr:hypothetical protein [Pseudomonadales bacterium]
MIELFERAGSHAERTAFGDGTASVSYAQLLQRSERVASALLGDKCDLAGERIAAPAEAGPDEAVRGHDQRLVRVLLAQAAQDAGRAV